MVGSNTLARISKGERMGYSEDGKRKRTRNFVKNARRRKQEAKWGDR
jgi:hypothetical protein